MGDNTGNFVITGPSTHVNTGSMVTACFRLRLYQMDLQWARLTLGMAWTQENSNIVNLLLPLYDGATHRIEAIQQQIDALSDKLATTADGILYASAIYAAAEHNAAAFFAIQLMRGEPTTVGMAPVPGIAVLFFGFFAGIDHDMTGPEMQMQLELLSGHMLDGMIYWGPDGVPHIGRPTDGSGSNTQAAAGLAATWMSAVCTLLYGRISGVDVRTGTVAGVQSTHVPTDTQQTGAISLAHPLLTLLTGLLTGVNAVGAAEKTSPTKGKHLRRSGIVFAPVALNVRPPQQVSTPRRPSDALKALRGGENTDYPAYHDDGDEGEIHVFRHDTPMSDGSVHTTWSTN